MKAVPAEVVRAYLHESINKIIFADILLHDLMLSHHLMRYASESMPTIWWELCSVAAHPEGWPLIPKHVYELQLIRAIAFLVAIVTHNPEINVVFIEVLNLHD